MGLPIVNITSALGLGCLLSLVLNVALWQSARADRAAVAPLKQAATEAATIAQAHQQALMACEASKEAMREANERALAKARAEALAAEASAEEFRRRLANPGKLPKGCETILTAQVCPALMDY